ncbi:MAG: hypothetical protein Q9187_003813 [Circinaria calcarea]
MSVMWTNSVHNTSGHKYSDEELNTICVLSIHAMLKRGEIYKLLLANGSTGFTKKSLGYKIHKLSGTLSPSDQARLTSPCLPEPAWIHWQAQPIRDLSVQAILRSNGILDPPDWRSQTREDYIVVLMLHSELSSAEIATQLNQRFGGRVEADGTPAGLYVEANIDAWYFWTPDGSYQWWTSGLESTSERDDILRNCGVRIETGGA